jgi:death-on-curing protein
VTEDLDLDDLLAAATTVLGERPRVRDLGILEGALARMAATVFGTEVYPDLDAKAAALLHAIVSGHPLLDGNKRLGWVACRLFYRLNGRQIRMPVQDAYDLIVAIADGSLRDVPDIAAHLRPWVTEAAPDPD